MGNFCFKFEQHLIVYETRVVKFFVLARVLRCDIGKFSCAVFYEFTSTIVNRFLTNQNACGIV